MRSQISRLTRLSAIAVPLMAVCFSETEGQPASNRLEIRELGAGAVPLGGEWQFHPGDDPRWAAPEVDDSSWDRLQVDRPWGLQGHAGYSGIAWYRRHVAVHAVLGLRLDYSILFPDVEQAYEVYWNGVLIGHSGKLPPTPVWYYKPQPSIFPLPLQTDKGVLAVRVWRAPPLSDEDPGLRAGFMTEPLIGASKAVADAKGTLDFKWLNGQQLQFTENLLYALVALLAGLAWLRHRDQRVLFWMTGFTLMPPLLVLLLDARLPVPYPVAMALAQPLTAIRDISLWFLLLWLLDLRKRELLSKLARGLAWVSVGVNLADGIFCAIIGMPQWVPLAQMGDAAARGAVIRLQRYRARS